MSVPMQGQLFKYASKQGNCAFRTGAMFVADEQISQCCRFLISQVARLSSQAELFDSGSHRRHVVLVGGLGDALLFAPYIPLLASRLNTIGWCVYWLLVTTVKACILWY
jgi:Protein of unknown function (DUF1749)